MASPTHEYRNVYDESLWPHFKASNSIVVRIAILIGGLWKLSTPACYSRRLRTEAAVDLTLLIVLALQVLALRVLAPADGYLFGLAILIAAFGLWNALGGMLLDVVVAPSLHRDEQGGYILVRGMGRWLLLGVVNATLIVMSFAVLYRCAGQHFRPEITDSMTAVYQSALTFTTLGYGDFTPTGDSWKPKAIVLGELLYFIMFLTIRLPAAVSSIRIRDAYAQRGVPSADARADMVGQHGE